MNYCSDSEMRGVNLLRNPWFNKCSTFTEEERDRYGLRGLLPPRVSSVEEQISRLEEVIASQPTALGKYLILDGILQKYYSAPDNESEEKKYLNMISGQIKDCIKVPERLLKLSRNTEQTNTTFNVIAEITDILSLLDYDIKSKGIVLTQNFSNVKEEIYGNETDFKMIILNLLQNAIHAMPDGGTLEIKTNTNKDDLIISIKDSGCGISKNALKHIFEPFYSSSPDNEKKGTGLGLAIVKDLVLKLNAKITVSSTENVGSCFEITIPRHKSQKMLVK